MNAPAESIKNIHTVKDLLSFADPVKQAYLALEADEEYMLADDETKRIWAQNAERNFTGFLVQMQKLDARPNKDDVILVERSWMWDFGDELAVEEQISAEQYKRQDMKDWLDRMVTRAPKYDAECFSKMSNEELEALVSDIGYPDGYAFSFTEWEDVLGFAIIPANIAEFADDIQVPIHAILYEMTWNGFTREHQEERRIELEECLEESERIRQLPEEEQEKHYVSLDEMKKHLSEEHGFVFEEKSEERKAAERRLLFECMLRSRDWCYRHYSKLREVL